jgi:RimJ/RimL family protein N-acetyltransferase
MMRTEIRGERITLKAYEESFIPMLYEAATEASRDPEFVRWMPWCHAGYTIEESRDFVEKTVANWREAEDAWRASMQFGYGIFDAQTAKFIGGTGLNRPDVTHRLFNLGYWIRPSAQNRGAASAATRLLARAGFEDLPELERIEIAASVGNVASLKTAEKAGAQREGVLRNRLLIGGKPHDAVMFSFIREDFQ